MADLKVFSYLPNPRLYKATIAARFSGADIEIVGDAPPNLLNWLWDFNARELSETDKQSYNHFARQATVGFSGHDLYKTDTFLRAHPFGNVPAAFSGDGKIGIFESNSIMRAAARLGSKDHTLLGSGPLETSRVDSFLDRTLVFARDAQRYLLSGKSLDRALYNETKISLESFAKGLEMALLQSPFLACESLTLADIAVVCELSLFTNETRYEKQLASLDLQPLYRSLRSYPAIGRYLTQISTDERFATDLQPYFEKLLAVWD